MNKTDKIKALLQGYTEAAADRRARWATRLAEGGDIGSLIVWARDDVCDDERGYLAAGLLSLLKTAGDKSPLEVLRDAERFYRRLLLTGVGGARYVQANSSALSNEVARLRLEALREFREKVAEWIEDIESGGE